MSEQLLIYGRPRNGIKIIKHVLDISKKIYVRMIIAYLLCLIKKKKIKKN